MLSIINPKHGGGGEIIASERIEHRIEIIEVRAIFAGFDQLIHLSVLSFAIGIVRRCRERVANIRRDDMHRVKASARAKVAVLQANLRAENNTLEAVLVDDENIFISIRANKITVIEIELPGRYGRARFHPREMHRHDMRRFIGRKS